MLSIVWIVLSLGPETWDLWEWKTKVKNMFENKLWVFVSVCQISVHYQWSTKGWSLSTMGPTLSNNDRVDCWFFLSELNWALSQLRANLLPSQYLLLFWLSLTNTESETSVEQACLPVCSNASSAQDLHSVYDTVAGHWCWLSPSLCTLHAEQRQSTRGTERL